MVLTTVYSIGGEELPNNPPTSARHPSGMMTYAGLHGDMQNLRIKSLRDNNSGITRWRYGPYGALRARRGCDTMTRTDLPHGYAAPIHRGVWERVLTGGVPRLWAAGWLVSCLYAGLLLMTVCGLRWSLVAVVLWSLGHGILLLLTQWDTHWDAMVLAHITRRYKGSYDAG